MLVPPTGWRTVHPHARGENLPSVTSKICKNGSPPRSWGKFPCLIILLRVPRFTPTLVGKIREVQPVTLALPVHPHARGENRLIVVCGNRHTGSPPRSWGKSSPERAQAAQFRFTPTLVGKISLSASSSPNSSVHPHARGENPPRCVVITFSTGSPPRSWGKFQSVHAQSRRLRFTPTLVGKMIADMGEAAPRPVHPHARGENHRSRGK